MSPLILFLREQNKYWALYRRRYRRPPLIMYARDTHMCTLHMKHPLPTFQHCISKSPSSISISTDKEHRNPGSSYRETTPHQNRVSRGYVSSIYFVYTRTYDRISTRRPARKMLQTCQTRKRDETFRLHKSPIYNSGAMVAACLLACFHIICDKIKEITRKHYTIPRSFICFICMFGVV